MKAILALSEFIIETLKDFSVQKRKLTVDTLSEALSRNKQAYGFLKNEAENGNSETPSLKNQLARVSLKKDEPSAEPDLSFVSSRLDFCTKVLSELEPISKGVHGQSFAALRQRLQNGVKPENTSFMEQEVIVTTRLLVSRIADEVRNANDFLAELSKDLVGMEKQLFTYQNHNRETYLLNDKFRDKILSHTEEVNDAASSTEFGGDGLIAPKLAALRKAIASKRQEDEVRQRDADFKIAELQKSVRSNNEQIHQVTERANALEKEALIDPLTEIHNRRAYEIEIKDSLRRFHRDGQPFSLVMVDVDHFKNVNDVYGHRAGDKCLQEIAKKLKSSLRRADFLARYGGEEIVAILHGSSGEDAQRVAEKLRALIEKTRFCYVDEEIPVTISVGVTEVRAGDTDSETTFVRVDEAMYRAKKEGRNRVCMI